MTGRGRATGSRGITARERRIPAGLSILFGVVAVTGLAMAGRADSAVPGSASPGRAAAATPASGPTAPTSGAPSTPQADTIAAVIGELPPGESVRVVFDAQVDDPVPAGVSSVSIQGTVTGTNFPDTTTDDPDTAAANDPTVTPLAVPCIPAVDPASVTIGPGAQTGLSVDVAAATSCSWDITNNAPSMLTGLSATSGTGNATITYDVAMNPTGLDRIGTLDVVGVDAGEGAGSSTHTVNQSATACSVNVNPASSGPLGSAGGTGSFAVETLAGCQWNAVPSDPAVTITSGASGNGNGTVDFAVGANPTALTRNFSVDVTVTNNGATASHAISQSPATCTMAVDPTSSTVPGVGGPGSFMVQSPTGCDWTAAAPDPAVTITAGASGSGNGTVTFDVAANPGGTPRSFSVTATVAGGGPSATHTVAQTALSCLPTVDPASATIPPAGGSSGFSVDVADASCAWTATASDPAVTITGGASGTGDGAVSYDVGASPGPARSFSIEVAVAATGESATHAIDQEVGSCSFTLTPTSASYPEEGGSGSVAVDANQPDCDWTATSDSEWLTVTAGASGSGDGTVDYDVAPSNWAIPRTGVLTIAGQAFTVEQEAGTCTFAVSPTHVGFGVFAGRHTITVDTGVGCGWEATSHDDWIDVESVDDGEGPGTVTLGIHRNETGEDREGTATIAGETVTVNQSGDGDGDFVLSPEAAGFPGAGGTGQVEVRLPRESVWEAVSGADWVTITSGDGGRGPGTIAYTVAPNAAQTPRETTIDVSGQTFTVKQAPAGESTLQIWITDVLDALQEGLRNWRLLSTFASGEPLPGLGERPSAATLTVAGPPAPGPSHR